MGISDEDLEESYKMISVMLTENQTQTQTAVQTMTSHRAAQAQ